MSPNGDFAGPGPEWSVHEIQLLKQRVAELEKRTKWLEDFSGRDAFLLKVAEWMETRNTEDRTEEP